MRKSENNVEFIARIMSGDFFQQAFVIAAVDSYARQIANSESTENGLINGDVWRSCAQDILKTLETRFTASNGASWAQWESDVEATLEAHGESITVGDSKELHNQYTAGEDSQDVAMDLLRSYGVAA